MSGSKRKTNMSATMRLVVALEGALIPLYGAPCRCHGRDPKPADELRRSDQYAVVSSVQFGPTFYLLMHDT